jgi:hypothetical protein
VRLVEDDVDYPVALAELRGSKPCNGPFLRWLGASRWRGARSCDVRGAAIVRLILNAIACVGGIDVEIRLRAYVQSNELHLMRAFYCCKMNYRAQRKWLIYCANRGCREGSLQLSDGNLRPKPGVDYEHWKIVR